jgi:2-polyprenyl-6-methoxyphenol hydroxylase-like FAD-dependent oxidoreductase
MSPRQAVIIGAGVAGLSAAWWLHRIGWRAVIVERAGHLRDAGYMMGLSGPGLQTAGDMGLRPRLETMARAIDENVYRDRNGREILRLRFRDFLRDLPYIALRRTDLVQALHDAVASSAELKLGTTVSEISNGPHRAVARLSDGAEIDADIVIAADGFRSQHRRGLFGHDEQFLKPLGYRFATYELEDTLGLGTDFLSYAEPGRLTEYYTLADGRLAALHVWRSRTNGAVAPQQRWDTVAEAMSGSHPHVTDMIEATRRTTAPIVDDLTVVDMPAWSRDRVLLLGDAAHCLTLISGQGAGISMASAKILAEELSRGTVEAAFAAHRHRLRPAVERLQQHSRKMATWFIPEGKFAFGLRNFWLKHLPRRILGRYFLNSIRSELIATQSLSPGPTDSSTTIRAGAA